MNSTLGNSQPPVSSLSFDTHLFESARIDKQSALSLLEAQRTALGVSTEACMVCAVCQSLRNDVVFETEAAQVRLDRFACTYGHLLIVPKQHVEHTTELTWTEYQHLQELAYTACAVLSRELTPKRVFIASLGSSKALAQSFPHFHIHVVPVFADDERARPAHVLSWSSGVTVYTEQQATVLTQRLARTWQQTQGEPTMSTKSQKPSQTSPMPGSVAHCPQVTPAEHSKPTRGLRRWLTAALGVMATNACSSGATSEPPPEPTDNVPVSGTAPSVTAGVIPTSSAFLVAPLHPTLQSAKQENPAKPVVTGTLLVTADGSLAFAGDVDRHAIFLVNLSSRDISRFDLNPDDEPGQMVEVVAADGDRHIFGVLRGSGELLKLDPSARTTDRLSVCPAPRGITYDAASNRVHVACETGELVTVDPDANVVERTLSLAPDLRDVQVLGESLVVSRFRSAEVLVVDSNGVIQTRATPDWKPECTQSAVMHRLVVRDSGVYISHQMGTTGTLDTELGGYASDFNCAAGPMEPVLVVTTDVGQLGLGFNSLASLPSVSLTETLPSVISGAPNFVADSPHRAFGMERRAGPVDLAVSSSGRIVASFTGDSLWPGAQSLVSLTHAEDVDGYSYWTMYAHPTVGMLTSVAFDGSDQWIAQSREPAQLLFEDGSTVVLDTASAANTGLDLFYVNTGLGLSCAGCHPEGDEDGRTWAFPQGLRRTQALGGGIMSRAPFHWDGEMPEMNTLVSEVMLNRMGFSTSVTEEQVGILGRWMDGIPKSPARLTAPLDAPDPAIERGRTLFNDSTVGCATCHAGAAFTDNKSYDVGTGGKFFTPTLLGIGLRNRFMHDGCATSLHERFGLCGGGDAHGRTSQLDETQVHDLVTFMETL